MAAAVNLPTLSLGVKEAANPAEVSTALQVLFVLTILSVAPAILLMTTAFTRIVIVLGFVRQAMGTQNMPPQPGITRPGPVSHLFRHVARSSTRSTTRPCNRTWTNRSPSSRPWTTPGSRCATSCSRQVQESELQLFIEITKEEQPADRKDVSTITLIPAFMLSELKRAFQMGFMIYVPFLVIDMIVASVLMSMGMMMLPPIIISLPFKLLLFVLVDGWQLVVGSLMKSFG